MNIAGIEISQVAEEPWRFRARQWVCFTYRVSGGRPVTRTEIENLIGREVGGRKIMGVESYCVERQEGKVISLCFDDRD